MSKKQNKNILIGAAWIYANYYFHVGHLASLLPSDIIARYHRAAGNQVCFVSGTDCHGTPITNRAKQEGTTPETIANKYHDSFVRDFAALNFSYDVYGKTSSDYHKKDVQEMFLKLYNDGWLYEKTISQEYCPTCNMWLNDREIVGTCTKCNGFAKGDQCEECFSMLEPHEIINKRCATSNTEVILKDNKHLYFKLSQLNDLLETYVNSHQKTWRTNAYNESKKYLNMGLIDRAVTRQMDWGIDVPVAGFEDKKIYVWIEAVMGYLTTCKQYCEKNSINFDAFLTKNSDFLSYFVHGKDNIPFHTIIFPALLHCLNSNWQLPTHIVSAEFITLNQEKMSKSKGNLYTCHELLEQFPADSIRFYTIYNNPEKKDTNYSVEDLITHHNKFLVGTIGNFINRNISYINKKFDGIIKQGTVDAEVKKETLKTYEQAGKLLEAGETRGALQLITEYCMFANKFYDSAKPWEQAHNDLPGFYNTTYTCAYIIANFANLLNPFVPQAAEKISKVFNTNFGNWQEVNIEGDLKVISSDLLFNRIEDK